MRHNRLQAQHAAQLLPIEDMGIYDVQPQVEQKEQDQPLAVGAFGPVPEEVPYDPQPLPPQVADAPGPEPVEWPPPGPQIILAEQIEGPEGYPEPPLYNFHRVPDVVVPRGIDPRDQAHQYVVHEDAPPVGPLENREQRRVVLTHYTTYRLTHLKYLGFEVGRHTFEYYDGIIGVVLESGEEEIELPTTVVASLIAFLLHKKHTEEAFLAVVSKCRELIREVALEPAMLVRIMRYAPIVALQETASMSHQLNARLVRDNYRGWWWQAGVAMAAGFGLGTLVVGIGALWLHVRNTGRKPPNSL
jgi:hypothetical protein